MNPDLFLQAQASPHAGYETARAELTVGAKREHWIWYIFPQMRGLGRSAMAQCYALSGLDEAVEYICHPVLGARYVELSQLVLKHLRVGRSLAQILGGDLDAMKFVSSATLFEQAALDAATDRAEPNEAGTVLTQLWSEVEAAGASRCARTLRALGLRV